MWDICSEAKRERRSTVHCKDLKTGAKLGTLGTDGLFEGRFASAHQRHDVVGQVSSQIRGHETREAGEGDASVILVGTAEILGDVGGWGGKVR